MTSMWMVQNDDGGWLQHSGEQFYSDYGYAMKSKIAMNNWIIANPDVHAHLVEMVPAKPKVPVSQEEADMLEHAKASTNYGPKILHDYVDQHGGHLLAKSDLEDRLIRGYVDGYTVVEPTKYNVKVPHTTDGTYYTKTSAGIGTAYRAANHQETQQFTMAEIKHYGLEDCERVEISTEDSDERD